MPFAQLFRCWTKALSLCTLYREIESWCWQSLRIESKKKRRNELSRKCTVVHPRFTSELCFYFECVSSSRSVEKFLCLSPSHHAGLPSSSWLAVYLFCLHWVLCFCEVLPADDFLFNYFGFFFNTSSCCLTSNLLWHSFTFWCFFVVVVSLYCWPSQRRGKRDYKDVAVDLDPTPRANPRLLWNFTNPN